MPSLVLSIIVSFSLIFAASAGEWNTVSPLLYAKSDHSAVTIGDGIFLVGGCSADQTCPEDIPFCICPEVTNITEVYFPTSDAWLPMLDAPHARFRHAAVAIGTTMYILGGRDVNDVLITKVDIFDTVGKTWSTSPYEWYSATSDLTAVAIGSVIYAIGGYDSNYATLPTIWSFDTSSTSPSWEADRIAPMIVPRGDSCTVAYENKIYVLGGYSDINFCDPLSYLEVYDFATHSWELKSPMDVDRGDFGCVMVHGKLHVIGGEHKDHVSNCSKFGFPINHVEVYDRYQHLVRRNSDSRYQI